MAVRDWFRREPQKQARAKRVIVRPQSPATFGYDAANRPYWDASSSTWTSTGPNASSLGAMATLRDRASNLVYNNPHARSAVNRLVDTTIGTGLTPRFGRWEQRDGGRVFVDDPRANELFVAWAKVCFVTSDLDWWGIQDPIVRSWRTRGEALARRRWRRPTDPLPVPVQIEIMEGDHLDVSVTQQSRAGGVVVAGVDHDAIGRRSGYYVLRSHPADHGYLFAMRDSLETIYVPAADLAHLYTMERPGQVRGVTHLAAIIEALREVGDIRQAKRLKLQAESSIVGAKEYLEEDDGNAYEDDDDAEDAPNDDPITRIGPLAQVNLAPGEKLTFAQQTSSPDYDAILTSEDRRIAVGADVSYELLAGDLRQANYSSLRAASASHNLARAKERENILQPMMLDRMVQWFVDAAALSGKLNPAGLVWQWSRPRVGGIDKEQCEIDDKNLANGTVSEIEVISARGDDWRKVLAERSQYREEARRLGLSDADAASAARGNPPA